MPEPVLELVLAIVKDGAALAKTGLVARRRCRRGKGCLLTNYRRETNPVATAADGLFLLPTLALSLFRALSPHYYAKDTGGNM